jgi:serine/threonine protein kinase
MRALRAEDPVRVGSYRPIGILGGREDRMVYLAEDAAGSPVVCTVLRVADEEAEQRFWWSAEAARRVPPFVTAPVLDIGTGADGPYVVREYVPGELLSDHIARERPLGRTALDRLAIGLSMALCAIHGKGLVSVDVTPDNALLTQDGLRIIDLGTTRPGTGPIDQAGDVHAWGTTIAHAATGLSALHPPLRALAASALATDPEHRPTADRLLPTLLDQPTRP